MKFWKNWLRRQPKAPPACAGDGLVTVPPQDKVTMTGSLPDTLEMNAIGGTSDGMGVSLPEPTLSTLAAANAAARAQRAQVAGTDADDPERTTEIPCLQRGQPATDHYIELPPE